MRKTRADDFATKKKKKNTFVSFIFAKSPLFLSFFLSFFLLFSFFLSFSLSRARPTMCVRVCPCVCYSE